MASEQGRGVVGTADPRAGIAEDPQGGGRHPADPAGQARPDGGDADQVGPRPGGRLHRRRGQQPAARAGGDRRPRHAHLRRDRPRAPTRSPTASPTHGVKEGDGVAIMCRNHRGFVEATVAVAKLGAHALYLNTAFAAPQLTEVVKREKPVAIVFDEEFTDLLEDAAHAAQALHRLARLRRPRRPHAGGADRGLRRPSSRCPRRRSARRSSSPRAPRARRRGPTAHRPTSLDPAVSLLSKIPLQAGPGQPRRGAAVPLLGLRPLHDGHAARLDDGAHAQVRPRGDASR